ncbi:hypothetical protein [Ruania suaedae]|nr:hypothetical protein [Ruania suaedae]
MVEVFTIGDFDRWLRKLKDQQEDIAKAHGLAADWRSKEDEDDE